MILSIDIETYGACIYDCAGKPFPQQRDASNNGRFHPYKSRFIDRPSALVLTCSVTVISRSKTRIPTLQQIANWRPRETMVFLLHKPMHRRLLYLWLRKANVLVGHNLLFDLLYLREDHYLFRGALCGKQLVIDTMMMNYMHNEFREERSLKALLTLFGLGSYTNTLKDDRFRDPDDPLLAKYNGEDTHATVLVAAELARRMLEDYTGVPKLSAECLKFYSDELWYTIRMSEAGVPFSIDKLLALHDRKSKHIRKCSTLVSAATKQLTGTALKLEGSGSKLTQKKFIDYLVAEVDKAIASGESKSADFNIDSILEHPLLQKTEALKEISWNHGNFNLFRELLPSGHPARGILRLVQRHSRADKLVTSYTQPLLFHKSGKPNNKMGTLLPLQGTRILQPHVFEGDDTPTYGDEVPFLPFKLERQQPTCGGRIGMAYGNWFIYPSTLNDTGDGFGGVVQPRATLKNPALQTSPKIIKKCQTSRWSSGHYVGYDLSQIELRVAALLSGDKGMIHAYTDTSADLHTDMAIRILGSQIVQDPNWDTGNSLDPRKWGGKVPNFLVLYRGREARLQQSIVDWDGPLFPIEFCADIVKSLPEARPGLWDWQEALLREAESKGYLSLDIMGHTRLFMGDVRGELESTVCNFKVQSWAALVLREIQHKIANRLPDINHVNPKHLACCQVYDAVYLDTHDPSELNGIVMDATAEVASSGLWARLSDLTGNHVPLIMDID